MPESVPTNREPRRLLVYIYDVAPPFEAPLCSLLGQLDALGVRPRVLNVVPNWHGRYELRSYTSLIELLRAESAAGIELVLHGWEHRQQGRVRGPWYQALRARLFTGWSAEFAALDALKAAKAIERGLAEFDFCGLERPKVFSAPGRPRRCR